MNAEIQNFFSRVERVKPEHDVAKTTRKRHGEDFYARIGSKGGKTPKTRPSGFASMSKERLIEVSRKGGKVRKNA